ncbi:ATP-binding cassette domain-containing protein [Aquabacter sp. P-9]|uniref:ATP-binding cassette domain-containing protein n=1 Tax=Aquabacter sediminis TaxID=3029197 RepID=UPI00237DA76F|nr:ATP-binding cassette domain-containing protein [Aquabacter sp. P-9]MDE1566751.1 ATP-binding cassette domain-containing protein [Aquabacter sp. P-9]
MVAAPPHSPLWEAAGLAFRAGGRDILHPLDLSLAAGQVHGLLGPNGSGKSTLMKLLARQQVASAGEVRFEGRPLSAWSGRAFARKVAYMPQFTPAAEGMSVRELVALGRYPWHGALGRFGAGDAAAVEAALRRTDLLPFSDRLVDSLSGGERQRAWLALMLAQGTRCLLLDEPTSALDIAHQIEVLAIVRDLARSGTDMSVVVVLHDINLAVRTCDTLVALKGGRLIAKGSPRDIMEPETLRDIYGLPIGVMPHPVTGEPLGYVL